MTLVFRTRGSAIKAINATDRLPITVLSSISHYQRVLLRAEEVVFCLSRGWSLMIYF